MKLKWLRWWMVGTIAASIVVLAFTFAIHWFGLTWTGFGPETSEPKQHAKTLWDWMQLLIVPAALAMIAFLFNLTSSRTEQTISTRRYENDQQIALDKQREDLLQTYLDRMSELLLEKGLRTSTPDTEVRNVARVRTITILFQLDARRIGYVFAFLRESGLMSNTSNSSIVSLQEAALNKINLSEADLSKADLSKATLRGADFHKANLSEANLNHTDLFSADLSGATLSGADLSGAILREAILREATLIGATLWEAILTGATLIGATLWETDLRGTNLSGAILRKADLWKADLRGTNLSGAILREATLSYADLSGADLRRADLREADLNNATLKNTNITQEQIKQAKPITNL